MHRNNPTRPKDHLFTEAAKKSTFKPSFESGRKAASMTNLLTNDYSRMWHEEHENYVKKEKDNAEKVAKLSKEMKNMKLNAFKDKRYKPKNVNVSCKQAEKKVEKKLSSEQLLDNDIIAGIGMPKTTADAERFYNQRRLALQRGIHECECGRGYGRRHRPDSNTRFLEKIPPLYRAHAITTRDFALDNSFNTCCKLPGFQDYCLNCSKPLGKERFFNM